MNPEHEIILDREAKRLDKLRDHQHSEIRTALVNCAQLLTMQRYQAAAEESVKITDILHALRKSRKSDE